MLDRKSPCRENQLPRTGTRGDRPVWHCSHLLHHQSQNYAIYLVFLKFFQMSHRKSIFTSNLKSLFSRNLSFCQILKTVSDTDGLTWGIRALIMGLQTHSKSFFKELHCQQLVVCLNHSFSMLENIPNNLTVGLGCESMQAQLARIARWVTVR